MKVYDLMIPGEQRKYSESLYEVIAYSALNYAALSWLIIIIFSGDFYEKYNPLFFFLLILILLVFPILWPIIYLKLLDWDLISKHIVHPIKKPWDYIFMQGELHWVIVHLKNGGKIGGKWAKKSYASSYPAKEKIYLEEVWKIDKNGKFIRKIKRTDGIIVLGDDIMSVEFFK